MAISWGAWSSNNRLRCGVEVTMSPSTVTSATTSVTLTTKVYLQTRYASYENGSSTTWWITGSVANSSGNTDWNLGDMGYKLMGQTTTTVTLQYGSSQSKSASGRIHSYYAYAGTEATASQSITVPARPYSVPAAPSGLSAARVSDTKQTLTWANHATTAAPYSYVDVVRKDNVATSYVTIATVSGSSTSYSDTTTRADRVYTYGVRSRNSVGSSGYTYSSSISTTPAVPGTPTAAKNTTGDIVVTRGSLSSVATGGWEVWHAAGGVWDSTRLALVAQGTTTYTHTAPDPSKTHQYRLRAVSANPTLTSTDSTASNVVQLQAAPNAPTSLAPSGVAADATEDITFTWTHNPVDTTEQTAYEVQYRAVGTTPWTTTGQITSTSSSHLLAAGTLANGQDIEWQVRTWGAYASPSPFSSSATLTLSSRPTVSVSSPDSATAYATSVLTVSWGYYDAEGQAQAQYRMRLYAADGTTLIETRSAASAATSTTFGTRLSDGASYVLTAEVQDSTGLWSLVQSVSFSVSFAVPPTPSIAPTWLPDSGACSLSLAIPDPVDPEVPTDHVDIYRSIDGGEFVLVAGGLIPTDVPDKVNECGNPDFEDGTATGWSSYVSTGTPVADAGAAYSGAYGLKATATGATTVPRVAYSMTGFAPGDFVSLTARVRVSGAGWTANARPYPIIRGPLVGGGEWTYATATYEGPDVDGWYLVKCEGAVVDANSTGTVLVNLGFSDTVAPTGDFHVDEVLVQKAETADTYFAPTLPMPATVSLTDYIPALNASNVYKAVAVSSLPSVAESDPTEVITDGAKHLFVNAGPGFADSVRVESNVDVSLTTGRARALRRAAGRTLPVPFDGEQETTEVSVSATIWRPSRAPERAAKASTWQEVAAFAKSYSPACFRDPDGNRLFVAMSPVRITGLGTGAARSVSWTLTEVAYAEPTSS